ncbi:hypothetical protein [Frankia sp. AgB32]|uniref:hypothetical protein n=1 Tax=Frankia sp. AgB32 TaxID=631119 RepID=UPI002010A10A|nr:hypothetical protein [Frankia sp. AgB32]MCK9894400.1 hypothetical protein [Frankia sp. AgB32]
MPRPTDWSPLGLPGDPTPGDPDALAGVADFMVTMAGHADAADTGLRQVVAKSGEGAFVGKTADWLRDTVNTAIQDFVGGVRQAFHQTEPAVRSYLSAMRDAQARADSALAQAAGLAADDQRRDTLAGDAKAAGGDQERAAKSAAETIRGARGFIHSPNPKKSACEVFWEIFGWIVLAITVVAVFVGGPIGLLALGLNAVLATKAVIDFAEGKTNIAGLVIGLLGLLGPSTKPLIALATLKNIVRGALTTIKDAVSATGKTIARLGNDFWHAVTTLNLTTIVNGIGDIAATIGRTVRSGSLWKIKTFSVADVLASRGLVTLKGAVLGFPAATGELLGSIAAAGGRLPEALAASVAAVPGLARDLVSGIGSGLRAIPRLLSNEFGEWKWLKIFLPLHGVEIGALGVHDAFRLAVLGRGLGIGDHAALAARVKIFQAAGGAVRVTDGVLHNLHVPEPGMTHADSGLLVPEPAAGVSGIHSMLGAGVSAHPGQAGGLGGQVVLPGSSLAGVHLPTTAGENLATTLPGGSSPALAHGVSTAANLSPTGLHPLGDGNPLSGIAPTAGLNAGDLTSPARLAAHHATDQSVAALPELRAAANGDVSALQLSDGRVAFNLNAADDGRIMVGTSSMHVGGTMNPAGTMSLAGTVHAGGTSHPGGMVHSGGATHAGSTAHSGSTVDLGSVAEGRSPVRTLGDGQPGHLVQPGSPALPAARPELTGAGHPASPGALDTAAPAPARPAAAGGGPGHLPAQAGPELVIGAGGVQIRGTHLTGGAEGTLGAATGGRPGELVGVGAHRPGAGEHTTAGSAAAAGGRRSGPGDQPVRSALDLLAEPPRGEVTVTHARPSAGPDGASARLGEPSLAGSHGPGPRLDTAGASPHFDPTPAHPQPTRPLPSHSGPSRGGPSDGGLPGDGPSPSGPAHTGPTEAKGLDAALDDLARSNGEVRHAQEQLAVTRASAGPDPAAAGVRLARAAKDLQIKESLHHKLLSTLRASGVADPVAAAGERAWAQYRIALHQLADAQDAYDRLHPRPGAPSRATSSVPASVLGRAKNAATPAQLDATAALADAQTRFGVADERLDALGLNPAHLHDTELDELRRSLLARPRILGGMNTVLGGLAGLFGFAGRGESIVSRDLAHDLYLIVEPPSGGSLWGSATHHGHILGADDEVIFRGEVTEAAGGFRIVDPDDASRYRVYDAEGILTDSGGGLTLTDSLGRLGHLEIGPGEGRATLHDPGGRAPVTYDHAAGPGGEHRITAGDGTWREFDADGDLTRFGLPVRDAGPGAGPLGQLEISPNESSAVLHGPGGEQARFDYAEMAAGEHRITAVDGSWRQFGADGTLTRFGLDVRGADNLALGRLEVDPNAGTGVLHGADGDVNVDYLRTAAGEHRITAPDGSWQLFGADGTLTRFGLDVRGAPGHPQAGLLGQVEIDPHGGWADLRQAPGQDPRRLTYQRTPAGDHLLTDAAAASWQRFDARGTLIARGGALTDLGGNAAGTVHIDLLAGTARHDLAGLPAEAPREWTAIHGVNGDYRFTNAAGEMMRQTPDGRIVEETVLTSSPYGTAGPNLIHAQLDAHGAVQARLLHNNAAVPGVRVDVEPGVGYRITDTAPGPHNGDHRVIASNGKLLSEHITVLRRDGTADGTHLSVTYRPKPARDGQIPPGRDGTWTRSNGTGRLRAGHGNLDRDGNPRAAYNSGGSVTTKVTGDVELVGADRKPFYSRESLGTGTGHPRPTLEVFRATGGRRYWHAWAGSHAGTPGTWTGRGTRTFTDLPEGRMWVDDQHHWPLNITVRKGRTTADGVVRAEAQADGSWRWYRFTADGTLAAEGVRVFSRMRQTWLDVHDPTGTPATAQQYNSVYHSFANALHYREHPITQGAPSVAYKEFSPQLKDTGSLEVLHNGNHLVTTRWAEQKPPQLLWRNPDTLTGAHWFAARVLGRKLGAVDFPNPGLVRGDSRYQVFRWTEQTAGGNVLHSGVRAVTPDGSYSDFTRDGLFVRGKLKLDDGSTLEIGKGAHRTWESLPPGGVPQPAGRTLRWTNGGQSGTRFFSGDGRHWVDATQGGDAAAEWRVVRYTDTHGNIVHVVRPADRPRFDPNQPPAAAFAPAEAPARTITRNTMGQIIDRRDEWPGRGPAGADGAVAPITVHAEGDPRTGTWTWDDGTHTGIRVSGRNKRWTGAWDDSYRDFTLMGNAQVAVRDLRALDRGRSLAAWRQADGSWRSEIRGIDGTREGGEVKREFQLANGTWQDHAPAGTGRAPWRDVDEQTNNVLRETAGGRVLIYDTPRGPLDPIGHGTWREYDHGAVFRTRTEPEPGLFRETESFHKQWRETDAGGRLLRFRSLSGTVWERGPLNRWSIQHRGFGPVGREFEFRGLASEFRGKNRMWRESNRLQYKAIDGLVGEFVSPLRRTLQKAALDLTQEFLMDFTAQVGLALAFNQGDLHKEDWFRALTGSAVGTSLKITNSVVHDRWKVAKGYKDGLANLDSGKDWNRSPYNHDKFWDNDWASTENPPRWRQSAYDYFQGTIVVNFVASYVANAVNAAAFGLPKDYIPLHGGQAALAGAWGGAGTLIISSTIGGARTITHLAGSGRYFHRGGLVDLTAIYIERVAERAMGAFLLLKAIGVRPQDNITMPKDVGQGTPAPSHIVAPPEIAGTGGDD